MDHDWDEHYASGEIPWDRGRPAPELVDLVEAGCLPEGRALDVGCGTGTNVRYLAGVGYDAVGIDVSALAIELAKAGAEGAKGSIRFQRLDLLADGPPAGEFDLVFDRGCLHVFDEPDDRALYARRVAECLAPDGLWLSLLGSTEGPPREEGPPRRSARDIAIAVEPALQIVELRNVDFDQVVGGGVDGWVLIARLRKVPAQPSTRRER
jgi:SAM-dependent methyltransferase